MAEDSIIESGKTLKQFLSEHGATAQQLESRAVKILEDAAMNEEVSRSETVRETVENLERRVSSASSTAYHSKQIAEAVDARIETIRKKVAEIEGGVKKQVASTCISSRDVLDGLIAYERMLQVTVEVFGTQGRDLSDEVICKAIDAASYGMWRSVMGPKSLETDNRARKRI